MKAKQKQKGGIPFTAKDARIFQQVFDMLDGDWSDEAESYMRGYIRLWKHYNELRDRGVNVRISPPKLGCRGPFLIPITDDLTYLIADISMQKK